MNGPGPSPYAQSPTPKKGHGCLIALAIVGGLIALGVLAIVIGGYAFIHSDSGKKVVGAIASGAQMAAEAQNAPGAAELRGIGCDQAMVMDMKKFQELGSAFVDGGTQPPSKLPISVTVVCQSHRGNAPSCDQVAATYVEAVGHASGKFSAQVSISGANACSALYSPEGAKEP
jgi:hypothetical protein